MSNDRVDRENKIIRGYSVMSLGEAKGHGFAADETTLEQLVALGNGTQGGMKTRVRHPGKENDGFARYLGKSTLFRREGDRVVADMQLSQSAFVSPEGDYGSYLMARAEEDASGFGASPEIEYTLKNNGPGKLPTLRLKSLKAIAVVDDPATNTAFFSCLSAKDDDMADANLETKNAELSAERDLLAEEVTRLKTRVTTLESDVTAKSAELSVAKTDAAALAVKDERARAGDVLALCQKAGKADLSAKYITDGTPTADVQRALFDVLCTGNKPIGEGDGTQTGEKDENAAYKTEYAALSAEYSKRGVSEADYVALRRIDDGKDQLIKAA